MGLCSSGGVGTIHSRPLLFSKTLMYRILLFLFLLASISWGQSNLVQVTIGRLQCGAVRRSANTVQPYCYRSGILVFNSIGQVSTHGWIGSFNYDGDSTSGNPIDIVTWSFSLDGQGGMKYEIAGNLSMIKTGVLLLP